MRIRRKKLIYLEKSPINKINLDRLALLTLNGIVLGRLNLARESEIREIKFAALSISSDQVCLLGIEESQCLAARAISVHTHSAAEKCPLGKMVCKKQGPKVVRGGFLVGFEVGFLPLSQLSP